jgi:hypothetical protein
MRYIVYTVLALFATAAQAEVKYLHYKYNHNVVITISNVECPIPKIKDQYDYAVIARRVDGASLIGCYRKENEDNIRIQWHKGDVTILPANAFLLNPDVDNGVKSDTTPKTAI